MNHASIKELPAFATNLGERAARLVVPIFPLVPAAMLAISGWRQRWMDDDGFINLRVVRNVLHGHGPIFNLGERIEVGTSPLWTAILTLFGALGAPLEQTAVYLGIVLSVVGLVLAVRAANRFQDRTGASADGLAWPVGIAIYAVLPAAWDYASSGLETGLVLAWLGGSYAALAQLLGRTELRPRSGGAIAAAALFGLGPLIRPELALYSAAWFVPLVLRLARDAREAHENRGARHPAIAGAASLVCLGASAIALPLAYELFRMGYYATVTPNTAIAKEAFRANWEQGGAYFRNFFGTYAMAWPTAGVALFLDKRLRALHTSHDRIGTVAAMSPIVAGLVHVLYIVAIGGDYMHGRMFLPPVFAILLPIAVVRLGAEPRWMRFALGGGGAMLVVWMGVCCLKLRCPQENQHDIGDERGWYAREADVPAPVTLSSYRKHKFYKSAQKELLRIEDECSSISGEEPKEGPACRTLYLDDDGRDKDIARLAPERATYPLAADTDLRVGLAVASGAIGIFGYLMPDAVHVIDRHGLSEPLASHLELGASRGRPGHEKKLGDPWLVARYASPVTPDDSRAEAARRALGCGELRELLLSATAPLTWGRFFENMSRAFAYTKLRIPQDPFEAESRFCGTPLLPSSATGGNGGDKFRWECPEGTSIVAVRGELSDADDALARVQPICGTAQATDAETTGDGAQGVGPTFGRKRDSDSAKTKTPTPTPFEVTCPSGSAATGFFGTSDKLVQGLGLVCAPADPTSAGPTTRSTAAGATKGTAFELGCKHGERAIGIVGRAGSLIDRLGIICGQ